MIVIHEKGDKGLKENYRPISLLFYQFFLLMRIIVIIITNILDQYQHPDHFAFLKWFSTTDHLLTIKVLIQKDECNLTLFMGIHGRTGRHTHDYTKATNLHSNK